jgi:hypothetical protein
MICVVVVVSLEAMAAVVLVVVEAMQEAMDVVIPHIKPGTNFLLISYVA